MSETMRRQIEAEARAARGKLPPAVGVACARPAGFPTAAARSSDITEAREDHAEGGIPEGGNSPAPDVQPHEPGLFPAEPVFPESCRACGVYEAPRVQAAIRDVRRAASKPRRVYRFEFTHSELIHAHTAVSQDRDRTLKAIRKGIAAPEDLKASDSLWEKLQAACFAGMRGGAR